MRMHNRIIAEYLQITLDGLYEIDLKTSYETFLIEFLHDELAKQKMLIKGQK